MTVIPYIFRAFFIILAVWTVVRLMGKKNISEMTGYDLVTLFLATTIAAEPLVYKITSKAATGVFIVLLVSILLGKLSLKKVFYNLDTDPIILVANGKIHMENLKKIRMNIPLMLSEIRTKGYQNIRDLQLVIFEPNGKLSVIPKSKNRPVQPSDLNIEGNKEGLALPLIIDGKIQYHNLKFAKLNEDWLYMKLNELKLNLDDIIIMEMDSRGDVYVQDKNSEITFQDIFQQMT